MTEKEKKERVLELYEEGLSYGAIANETGIPKSTVYRFVNDSDEVLERSARLGTFHGTSQDDDLEGLDEDLEEGVYTDKLFTSDKKGLSGADLIALQQTTGAHKLKLMEQKHRLNERSKSVAYDRQMQLLKEQKEILLRKQRQDEIAEQRRIRAEQQARKAETFEEILEFFEETLDMDDEEIELTDLQAQVRQAKRLRAKFTRVSMEMGVKKEIALESKEIALLDELTLFLSQNIAKMQDDRDDDIELDIPKRLFSKIEKFLDENADMLSEDEDFEDEAEEGEDDE